MFPKLFGRLFRIGKKAGLDPEKALHEAESLMHSGDKHAAILALRAVLEIDPYCVVAHNDLGACLADIGDNEGATVSFERAYALDDTFLPAVVNHAKMLCDMRKSQEALPLLENAKLSNPEFTPADAIYASACLHLGDLKAARHFQLRAWLADFDSMRLANARLFYACYDDIDESTLAAEHRFWAETLKPNDALTRLEQQPGEDGEPRRGLAEDSPQPDRKIRIGYWSPDFRRHSVRFFFRPLLESHDTSRFEIFLYHDVPQQDDQTELIKKSANHFHDVCAMSDVDLYALIRSHQLDIFIELAGHTSNNRIAMLAQRFAKVQISALGYPPTTGLSSLDGKLMDHHVVGPDSRHYYTERPLILPTAFWCFDPMEESHIAANPPMVRNGYVTFGCVGNIVKISERMLADWKQIMDGRPHSRLLLRAINFEEGAAMEAMRTRLLVAGLDVARVDLRGPEVGAALFESYNDIDIILDTYPFNGGTTTCFATYMGVPVISLFGDSLISRMGLSILSNLGVADLAVDTQQAYVHRAIALANDKDFLLDFKRTARQRFKRSCLGNGSLFAAEFEQACLGLLRQARARLDRYDHAVPALPADEIIRRAFFVMRKGQHDAVRRILAHCLKAYPDNGTAHVLTAQQLASEQKFGEAVNYLSSKLPSFKGSDERAALICLARFHMLMDERELSLSICRQLLGMDIDDPIDRLQVELFMACNDASFEAPKQVLAGPRRVLLLIPCDSPDQFLLIKQQILLSCSVTPGWQLSIECCDEARRVAAYRDALRRESVDIVVFMQKNIEIHHPDFFIEVSAALDGADIVGFAGISRWARMDWRLDEFELKAAGYTTTSSEKPGFVELQWFGLDRRKLVPNMTVLDGGMLAISRQAAELRDLAALFDEELVGSEVLLEEGWVYAASQAGCRLAVHRNLGVQIRTETDLDARYRQLARIHQARKLGFEPFAILKDDRIVVTAPVSEPRQAIHALDRLIQAHF